MSQLNNLLTKYITEAIQSLYDVAIPEGQIQLEKTNPTFEGDITLIVFPLLRLIRQKPEEAGNAIGAMLVEKLDIVTGFNVIKGFLNISISTQYWLQQTAIANDDSHFGYAKASGKTIMIEYSSPNTNKPLHLGHIRNNLLGYSVAEILKANGHKVIKTNLINDRGIHICKSMLAWQKWGNGETPESTGMKGDHLVGKYYVLFDKKYKVQVTELMAQGQDEEEAKKNAPLIKAAQEMLLKWEQNDPAVVALWKKMNDWVYKGFEEELQKAGC